MSVLKQAVLATLLVVLAGVLWLAFVPSAMPMLARTGALDLLGIAPPAASAAGDAQDPPGGRSRGPTEVVVAEVREDTLNDRATALGDGRAIRSVTVTPEVAGRVVELGVESGAQVGRGDTVARLDAEAERIALDRAKVMLSDAQTTLQRLERLQSSGAVPEVELQTARLEERTAELSLRQAEFALSQRRIAAPIDGRIGILEVEVGDRVTPTAELARIDDRSRILVEFRVPERFIGRIAPGDTVTATPVSRPDTALQGEIRAVDNRVEVATRTLEVQAALDNSGDTLRGGMAFRIGLSFAGKSYPAIDPLALQWGSDSPFVWAARDGTAEKVPVRIMQRNADAILIEADLAPGDLIVTEGVQTLDPGAEIEVQRPATAEAQQAAPDDPSES